MTAASVTATNGRRASRPDRPTSSAGAGAEPGRLGLGPIRTCVGCRAAVPQAELVRIAIVDGRAVADPPRRQPGRGAYVHARPACLAGASKGGLARSLKRGVSRAELDGLNRSLASGQPGDGRVTAAPGGAAGVTPADPGAIPPGQRVGGGVESGSLSARTMSNPRPTSDATAPDLTVEGAQRSS